MNGKCVFDFLRDRQIWCPSYSPYLSHPTIIMQPLRADDGVLQMMDLILNGLKLDGLVNTHDLYIGHPHK